MNEQHNNHQQKDVLTIYNEAAKAVTNEDYKSVSGTPARTGKKLPLAVEQFVPSRRTRINRLILRRRLHERYHRDIVFFFQAEDGIRDKLVTGVQTCALPI